MRAFTSVNARSIVLDSLELEGDMYSISDDEFQAFQHLIYTETGITLNEGKRCLVCSRLSKRLRSLRLASYLDYYDYLLRRDTGGEELQRMVNCITTNKTDFFRESHHFRYLTKNVFPRVVERARNGGPRRLRIWCSASSRGHEPYSIAMTVRECPQFDASWDIRLLASDIDTDVLAAAQQGVFNSEELEQVPTDWKARYFQRGFCKFAGQMRAKPALRDLLTFRQINLIGDEWPIRTTFDVIFCRNVMIYFDTPTQQRVVEHLARYLAPEGSLLLGHSENIQWAADYLRPLGHTIFQLVD